MVYLTRGALCEPIKRKQGTKKWALPNIENSGFQIFSDVLYENVPLVVLHLWGKTMAALTQRKWLMRGAVVVAVFAALLLYCVHAMLGYPSDVSVESPSGRYVMQNVPVEKIFRLGGMAYLRVTDKQDPQKVYRTPLYDMQSLDMRPFENDNKIGISWIDLDKQAKIFTISMPQWEESWLNIFISNTPYTNLEND